MKVGKAIYNILSQSTEVQSNFPFNDTNYTAVGSELVDDGNFPNGDNWNVGTGWSIANNKASVDGSGTLTLSQSSVNIVSGKLYKVSFEITDYESGFFKPQFGGQIIGDYNTSGIKTFFVTANSSSYSTLILYALGTSKFSVKNISVQEYALNKIFPELAPPGVEVPYIVYSVVSNSPSDTKNANGDIDTASIEVYGFQDTYNKAVDLGVSVRAALDRKTGTYNTIEIQSTNYVNEQMDVNEARKLWAAIQDYSIRIKNL